MQARIVMRGVLYQVLFTEAAEPQQVAGRSCWMLQIPCGRCDGYTPLPPLPDAHDVYAACWRVLRLLTSSLATPTIFRFRFALRSLPRVAYINSVI
jgi:hypothetical protein